MKKILIFVLFFSSFILFAQNETKAPPALFLTGEAQGNIPPALESWIIEFPSLLFAFLSQQSPLLEGTADSKDVMMEWDLNFQKNQIHWTITIQREEKSFTLNKTGEGSLTGIQRIMEEFREDLAPWLVPVTEKHSVEYYTESSTTLEEVVDEEQFNRQIRSSVNSISLQIGGGSFGAVSGQPGFWYSPINPLDIRFTRFSHLTGKSGFTGGIYLDMNDTMALAVDVDPLIKDPDSSDYILQRTQNTLVGCYLGYSLRMENRLGVELTFNIMPSLLTVEAVDQVDLTNFNHHDDYPAIQMAPGERMTLFLIFLRLNVDLYYNITPHYYTGISLDARLTPSRHRRLDSGFFAGYSVAPVIGALKLGYRF